VRPAAILASKERAGPHLVLGLLKLVERQRLQVVALGVERDDGELGVLERER